MSEITPEPSWEIFEECEKCGTLKGKSCWNLVISTTKNLVPASIPHRGRKRIK